MGRWLKARAAVIFACAIVSPVLADERFNFNSDWKLAVGSVKDAEKPGFNDDGWKRVTLPHAWNEDEAFAKDIHDLSTGIAWYRKTFTLPAESANKKVLLEFQGVRQGAEYFVNGKSLGLHENGVMACGLDVTALLNPPGKANVIAVQTNSSWKYRGQKDNSPYQWNDSNFYANYGGINKNVILHVSDKLYQTLPLYSNLGTTGVYVYGTDYDIGKASATVHAESQVKNEYAEPKTFTYEVMIDDADGKQVASFAADKPVMLAPGEMTTVVAAAPVSGLKFWSWGYGYLYTVKTTLKVNGNPVDTFTTRTGFRKSAFEKGYLTLNDRPIQVHGYAQRTTNEWPALGIDVPAWISDFSNGLMVASGSNLVRWMHVTPSKQDIESCDRVGLMESMPAGDAEKDVGGTRWKQRTEVMRDAIIYNRNNPSILFYECGNNGISEEHMAEMKAIRDQYDPHGGRAIGARDMMASSTAEYGGEMLYINKSAGKPMWAMEFMRDESLRTNMDDFTPPFHKDGDRPPGQEKASPQYHRNQDTMAIESVTRWYDYWRERPGTGDRVNGGGVNIIFSDSNTHHRGPVNYRVSGEVDAMRIPKEGFFTNQVMWDGWVDVEHPSVHIIGHWNYQPDVAKDVYVVSSADKVELMLNGKSLGFGQQSNRFQFTFPQVKFIPGTLTAVGYDATGKKICTTEVQTAGEPASLKMTPHLSPNGFHADGSDIALVDVEVVDAQGRRCPTAFNDVQFDLEGAGEWRGGIGPGENNSILAKTLPVQLGINRVIVRSTPKAGTITLKASTQGLPPATLELKTQPVDVVDGRSTLLPGVDLKSSLLRGPTPAGTSIHPTRKTLRVASVAAGSENDSAAKSIDDNEETGWSSSGPLSDAWIKYTLASPQTLNEVTMKLGSWRNRSYPIRILVDDHEVFAGGTQRSLGYVTIPFKPIVGKKVTIQLIGNPSDKDEFDMTEITGMKLKAGTTDGGKEKGKLQIKELELYGPLK